MPSTTHPEFNANTEALEVAAAFADGIRGKTVLVTGVNKGGIGYTTAEAFVRLHMPNLGIGATESPADPTQPQASQSPAHLIIASRTLAKMQECIDAMSSRWPGVDYRPLQIDLSSQASVRAAAATVLSWSDVPTIDIIVNSAGIMQLPERTLTPEGIEMHLATNHVGHFLLTCLLMPKLIAAAGANSANKDAAPVRIVNVTSGSPTAARMRWSDLAFDKVNKTLPESEQPPYYVHRMWSTENPEDMSYIPLEAYNQSKVANVLFGIGLNSRLGRQNLPAIFATAVHPGVIKTEITRITPEKTLQAIQAMAEKGVITYKSLGAGAATSLVAALDPKLAPARLGAPGPEPDRKENYGAFLMDCQISEAATPQAVSSEQAERLWKVTEEMVGETFAW